MNMKSTDADSGGVCPADLADLGAGPDVEAYVAIGILSVCLVIGLLIGAFLIWS
jgi:hypothetical protein